MDIPTKIDNFRVFNGGIAPYDKEVEPGQYAFGRGIDVRSNPREATILPKTTKESGSVYLDLPKDADRAENTTYIYDASGNIYTRSTGGSHALVRTVASSHGNGIKYFGEDNYLYYASDKVIGRYGQISGTPAYADDFLGSEGGVPLNTHWIDLESGSSQYATRADTASLSITGNLSLEAIIRPESLPTVGNSMTIVGKWDDNTNLRSYKFDIYAISGYFGDGSDGAKTVSSNETEAPIDSACTGTSGAFSLSATNVSFASGQVILIHQTQGSGAGTYQRNKIIGYTAGTITLETALNATYTTGAQVRVMKQYTDVTVNSGITWTAKAWDGTVGGILAFLANGTVTITGSISSSGCGFVGGAGGKYSLGVEANEAGYQGEGEEDGTEIRSRTANGIGGGGSLQDDITGGGGGHTTAGQGNDANGGRAGEIGSDTADLTAMHFGGGGGGGIASSSSSASAGGSGGNGGGIVFISGTTITVSGSIIANGSNGSNGSGTNNVSGGGGGAGGSVLLKAQTATLGSSLITASAGSGGTNTSGGTSYSGSVGRIHLDYYTSYTGDTTPTLDAAQDNTLVTNTSYQLRLGISSNGTNSEFLTKTATAITTATNLHVGVAWTASTSTAEFLVNGGSIGTSTGTLTAISDNASRFAVGADFNSSARNFFDGKVDETRVWNVIRTEAEFFANKEVEIAINTTGLVAYYKFNNNADDATANANNLTATGSPVYATDVPFSSPTTRLDLDQQLNTSGNTYALTTAISETAANRQTFVPDKDPQKSVEVNISDTGDDSDWTLTVHDVLNRTVASKTVTHANLRTGDFEFIFDTPWRPIRGASYHFHLVATTTTGTPLVVSTSSNDLETADFHTYYQFLVEDNYHPIEQIVNKLAFGNERYVATYDGAEYIPHRLVLPSGWRVRCLTTWQGYLAIGCWKGDSVSDYDKGIIFFWDGFSTTYNDFIEVPEGAINAMFGSQGTLFIVAGYQGDMLQYTGGAKANKIKRVPKITKGTYIETLPKAMNMWQALLRWGVAGDSDNTNVERGVYSYGQRDPSDPMSLTYDHPISTGSRASSGVQIGLVFPVDQKLLVGWKDGTAYGVDVIDPAGSPYPTATIERDIKDYGGVWKEKQAMKIRTDFKPLLTGESIKLKYKLDRASSWTEGSLVNTAGETEASLDINMGNHKEVQIAADMATSVSTAPSILELTLEENLKASEQIL